MKNYLYTFISLIILVSNSFAQPALDSIRIFPGWNIIGSIVNGHVDSVLYTNPPNAISSPFYQFNPVNMEFPVGYAPTDILKRKVGYWVKSELPAWLVFRPDSFIVWYNCGTVDYGGKIYSTIVIGEQCWLKPNLDIGTMIPSAIYQTNNGVIEKFCYDDNILNCETYGGLYQWKEAMQYVTTPGTQGICPNGWHIPHYGDFAILKAFVDENSNKLKAVGQGTGAGAGTNESGFSALLGGYYLDITEDFRNIKNLGWFWTSTEYDSDHAYDLNLSSDHNSITLHASGNKYNGISIRCIKD